MQSNVVLTEEQLNKIQEIATEADNLGHDKVTVDLEVLALLFNEVRIHRFLKEAGEKEAGVMVDTGGSVEGECEFGVSKDLIYTFKLGIRAPKGEELSADNLQVIRDCAIEAWSATLDADIEDLLKEAESKKNGGNRFTLN